MAFAIMGLAAILLISCNPAKKWEKEEKQQIQEYLSSLGDTVYVTKPSGLIFINLVEGTGRLPIINDTVSIRYKGSFFSGHVFGDNSTEAEPLKFVVGEGYLINGLDEGVRYIKEGGKAKLVTPSSIAYGSQGWGIISGYTPLRWVIEVVSVKAGPVK